MSMNKQLEIKGIGLASKCDAILFTFLMGLWHIISSYSCGFCGKVQIELIPVIVVKITKPVKINHQTSVTVAEFLMELEVDYFLGKS